MTPVAALKIGGGIAAALALTIAVADWRDARQSRAELRICAKAAGKPEMPLEGCTGKLATAIVAQRQGAACEAALAAQDLFGIRTSCGAGVLDRVARLSAAEASLADARQQLAQAEQRAVAAVSRAEARATLSAERKARAETAIASAPRSADGSTIICDARCLRALAGRAADADR